MRSDSVAVRSLEQGPVRLRRTGFTLIELSVVIAIIAVITAAGISMGGSMIESAKRTSTNNRLDAIEKALYAYRMANERLPCPGDASMLPSNSNYGIEAANKGTCTGGTPAANYSYAAKAGTVVEGAVPVKTLNLPAEFMYDAWGRKIAYAVWSPITAGNGFISYGISQNCGSMTIQNAGHGNRSTSELYTLVSYGPDGNGGYTQNGGTTRYNGGVSNADELTNCHCNSNGTDNGSYTATYIQKAMSLDASDANNPFQHLVRFKARWQMQNAYDTYSPAGNGMPCMPGVIINGYAASQEVGYSVAVGDINGDGIPDLIIGAPRASPNGVSGAGSVYVVFGTKSGFPDPLPLNTLNGINGFELDGAGAQYGSGVSLATGDVNGDGVADIIIGMPNAVQGNSVYGQVYVVFGGAMRKDGTSWSSCPCTLGTSFLNGTNGVIFNGTVWGLVGTAVAAGDVNGDGISDILIGDATSGITGSPDEGALYVVFGKRTGWSPTPSQLSSAFLNGVNGVEFDGAVQTSGGSSLANGIGSSVAAGDVNGDGIADIITGAPAGSHQYGAHGVVDIIFGKNPLLPQTTVTTTVGSTCATVASTAGLEVGDGIGSPGFSTNYQMYSNTNIGLIGSACSDSYGSCSGANCITLNGGTGTVNGANPMNVDQRLLDGTFLYGTNGVEFDGDTSTPNEQNAGYAVAVSDINGDGVADVIIGAPGAFRASGFTNTYVGAVYIVFGRKSGWPTTATTLNATFLNGINGVEFDGATVHLGASLGTGDVNGDGIADLLIGVPYSSTTGATYLLFGKQTGWSGTATTITSAYLNGVNGVEFDGSAPMFCGVMNGDVATGDINGDGSADIIMGSCYASPGGNYEAGSVYIYYGRKSGWPTSPFNLGGL